MNARLITLSYFLNFATLILACPFDAISDNIVHVPKIFVDYGCEHEKRSIADELYTPLRFYVHYDEVNPNYKNAVKTILSEATARVSELLSVTAISGPLLFDRTVCTSRWTHGVNHGRCSSVRSNYMGEFCANKIDNFKIPEHHLQSLDVYNYSGTKPIYSIPESSEHVFAYGSGIDNADYALYVKTEETSGCNEDVMAYASYCRLDQYARPVAGFINFCTSIFNETNAQSNGHFVKIAIHELIHALGFSKDLFSEYQGCQINSEFCDDRKQIVTHDEKGIYRLNFPSASEMMRNHLSCDDHDFGVPLETIGESYSSHWDSLVMYGSIMTSIIQETDHTYIDAITLAVLADSGWYKVNFSAADDYTWGKDAGCSIGEDNNCSSTENFPICLASGDVEGCDILHHTKTMCQKLNSVHQCGIFKPDFQNDCRNESQRCFMIEQDESSPVCAEFKCKSEEEFDVLLDGIWITCKEKMEVSIGNSTLICPDSKLFCLGFGKQEPIVVQDSKLHNSMNENKLVGDSTALKENYLWCFIVILAFFVLEA